MKPLKMFLFLLIAGYLSIILTSQAKADLGNDQLPLGDKSGFDYATDIEAVDFDHDGDLDLVVARVGNFNENCVATGCNMLTPASTVLHVNEGGGRYRQVTLISTSTLNAPVTSIDIRDLEQDGSFDLLVGTYRGPLQVYRCQQKACTLVKQISSLLSVSDVKWADMDNDGDLDVVVSLADYDVVLNPFASGDLTVTIMGVGLPTKLKGKGQVQWYKNIGNNNFSLQLPVISTETTFGLDVADYNGDGQMDISTASLGGVRIYGNNKGLFSLTWKADIGLTFGVSSGDIDNDGDLDLAIAGAKISNVSYNPVTDLFPNPVESTSVGARIYRNNTIASFTQTWATGPNTGAFGVAWGDHDLDGDVDLAVGDLSNGDTVYDNKSGVMAVKWRSPNFNYSRRLVWADLNQDRSFDLIVGGRDDYNPIIYFNKGSLVFNLAQQITSNNSFKANSIDVADINHDGYPETIACFDNSQAPTMPNIRLYSNRTLTPTLIWQSNEKGLNIARCRWGDFDQDGWLDLAVAADEASGSGLSIYRNNQAGQLSLFWNTPANDYIHVRDIAWADVNGDGDLELAAINLNFIGASQTRIYEYNGAGFTWSNTIHKFGGRALNFGDFDNDGDPDLAVDTGNLTIYQNEAGQFKPIWSELNYQAKQQLMWADLDGNESLELLVVYDDGIKIFTYQQQRFSQTSAFSFAEAQSIATSDIDYDGDLDLVAGSESTLRLYFNKEGRFTSDNSWEHYSAYRNTNDVKLLDWNGDGDIDIIAANSGSTPTNTAGSIQWFDNPLQGKLLLPFNSPTITLTTPLSPVITTPQVAFNYKLRDHEGDKIAFIKVDYSTNGGGDWQPALATTNTLTMQLTATLTGTDHIFTWDAINFYGRSDNTVVRICAYHNLASMAPAACAMTQPFRMRGTGICVTNEQGQPMPKAMVYLIPIGQSSTGKLLADNNGKPYLTDGQGCLVGSNELELGDQLMALAPVTLTQAVTWTKAITLYHTNGIPTETGVQMFKVTQLGLQELVVSANHPLLLFDLSVSLEWDSHNDPIYLQQLESDIRRASAYLYQVSHGQIALGQVHVTQNSDNLNADVFIYATNHMRPSAIQGGIVITTTPDPDNPNALYYPGVVRMTSTWNRYGEATGNIGEDWPLTLAHELSHYLLFQEDVYLGVNDQHLLITENSCHSFMGDMYTRDYVRLISDPNEWTSSCATTLANRSLGRTEWDTIIKWYPWLQKPLTSTNGPNDLPFKFTQVTLHNPITLTNSLADPTFYLKYQQNGLVSSSATRAFLFKKGNYIIDLGQPRTGQNRLLARGAEVGDRLCVFDSTYAHYGCDTVKSGNQQLFLEEDQTWQPQIQVTPINSRTLQLQVFGLNNLTLPLKARLYPELDYGGAEITLSQSNGMYEGTLNLPYPTASGYIQLWVDETESTGNPRRETMVYYSMGGNPGPFDRNSGPFDRNSGPFDRNSGPFDRNSGPMVASSSGEMIFFTENPTAFAEGQLYLIQSEAALPPLPLGKSLIGQGYNLVTSSGVNWSVVGSVSFSYLGSHAAKVDEAGLTIHFWNGSQWQALETIRDPYFNFVSAPSQGPGIYALLSGQAKPTLLELTPTSSTNDLTTTLTLTGLNFLSPIQVTLANSVTTYTLPLDSLTTTGSTTTLTVMITPSLLVDEYNLVVTNLTDHTSTEPVKFALYEPYHEGCFYDFFGSGLSRWQPQDFWQTIHLLDGNEALTDSPAKNYDSADHYGSALTHTSMITTIPFSLANCPNPALLFRHDLRLVQGDLAHLEISAEGQPWQELASYSGNMRCQSARNQPEDEWTQPNWQNQVINLSSYSQTTRLQLRLSLEVNQTCADKGWLMDDFIVKPYTGTIIPEITPTSTPTVTPTTLPPTFTATPTSPAIPPTFTPTPTATPTLSHTTNEAPKLYLPVISQAILEGQWFTISLPQFVDDDPLNYQIYLADGSSLPNWLIPNLSHLTLQGLASNAEVGEYQVVVSARDTFSATTKVTFTLTVVNVNQPPVITQPITRYEAIEDQFFTLDLSAVFTDTDPHDDINLTIQSQLPPGLTFANGILQGILANEAVGQYQIGVLATDSHFAQTPLWFDLVVSDTNDLPLAQPDLATASKNQTMILCPLINDSDPDKQDRLTLVEAQAERGQVAMNTPCLSYTAPNLTGLDTVTYTISDLLGLTSTTTIKVLIGGIQAPTQAVTTQEDMAITLPFTLPIEFATTLSGQLTIIEGQLIYTPPANFSGEVTIDYLASDKTSFSIGQITVTILPINDAPIASDDIVAITYVPVISFSVTENDSDPENNPMTVTHFSQPQYGQISQNQNTFIYTPEVAYNGLDSFEYELSDGALTSTATVYLFVFARPAPIALPDRATMRQGRVITLTPLLNDQAFSGTLNLLHVQSAQHGFMEQQGNTLIYTPQRDFIGTEVLTYQVADALATTAATVSITIIPNTPPIARPDVITLTRLKPMTLNVLANDSDFDHDPLTLTLLTSPVSGTVIMQEADLVYSPALAFNGIDTFIYTLSDGLSTTTTTVTIMVQLPHYFYLPLLIKP